jgi:hypothetical protein
MSETIAETGEHGSSIAPKPESIRRLEIGLDSVFHAFDQLDGLSDEHRRRVTDDLLGELADAASRAARSGHAEWALTLVRRAAASPPSWAEVGVGWVMTLGSALEVIEAITET